MSDLDKEFKEVVIKINAKLAEAAAAVNEANRLAEEAKLPGLIFTQYVQEDLDNYECDDLREKFNLVDVSDLEDALDSAGWSTSSSYC